MLCVRLQIRRLHLCLKPTVSYVFDLDVVFKRAIVIRKGDIGDLNCMSPFNSCSRLSSSQVLNNSAGDCQGDGELFTLRKGNWNACIYFYFYMLQIRRERESQTDRQTDTDGDRDRETDREGDRETET